MRKTGAMMSSESELTQIKNVGQLSVSHPCTHHFLSPLSSFAADLWFCDTFT